MTYYALVCFFAYARLLKYSVLFVVGLVLTARRKNAVHTYTPINLHTRWCGPGGYKGIECAYGTPSVPRATVAVYVNLIK